MIRPADVMVTDDSAFAIVKGKDGKPIVFINADWMAHSTITNHAGRSLIRALATLKSEALIAFAYHLRTKGVW